MTDLRHICGRIAALEPGYALGVSRMVLRDIASQHPLCVIGHNGVLWSAPEVIMENIVGSAYSLTYWEDPMSGQVTFQKRKQRLKEPGYTSPDRRQSHEIPL